jgi:hypothetical protein
MASIARPGAAVNPFEVARQMRMVDIVTKYTGAHIERHGYRLYILCPFHQEKTASCLIDQYRYRCFGCGEHGDRMQFLQKLFHITALEAAKMICRDFGLLPVGVDTTYRPELAADVAERRRKWNEQALRRRKVDIAGRFLALVVRMISYRLRTPADLDRFGVLAQAAGEAETILDMLASKDTAVQDMGLAAWESRWVL